MHSCDFVLTIDLCEYFSIAAENVSMTAKSEKKKFLFRFSVRSPKDRLDRPLSWQRGRLGDNFLVDNQVQLEPSPKSQGRSRIDGERSFPPSTGVGDLQRGHQQSDSQQGTGIPPSRSWSGIGTDLDGNGYNATYDTSVDPRMKKVQSYSGETTDAWTENNNRPAGPPGWGVGKAYSGAGDQQQVKPNLAVRKNYENMDVLNQSGTKANWKGTWAPSTGASGHWSDQVLSKPPDSLAQSAKHARSPSWPVSTGRTTGNSEHSQYKLTRSQVDVQAHTPVSMDMQPAGVLEPVSGNRYNGNYLDGKTSYSSGTGQGYPTERRSLDSEQRETAFHQAVLDRLNGVNPDKKDRSFSLDSSPHQDMVNVTGLGMSYPKPVYDKDGRLREDKDYSIPSPPERDVSGQTPRLDSGPVSHFSSPLSPPPPLPDTSPPQGAAPGLPSSDTSLVDSGVQSGNTSYSTSVPRSSPYPVIVRTARPCYNSCTQTETEPDSEDSHRNAEVQVNTDSLNRAPRVVKEEKSVQARWGSIVGHAAHTQPGEEGVYETLVFPEEKKQSPAAQPVADRAENLLQQSHRIPETIQEDVDSGNGQDLQDAISPSVQKRILEQIQEHSPSQTYMLRKLSQEFFGKGPAVSHSQDSVRDPGNRQPHRTQDANPDSNRDKAKTLDNKLSAPEESPSGEERDVIGEIPNLGTPVGNPTSQYFDRNKNMSLRKAYGIFDEIENYDEKQRRKHATNRAKLEHISPAAENRLLAKHKQQGSLDLSQNHRKDEDNRRIAEAARREWMMDHPVQALSTANMRRTTSEQLRPLKEKLSDMEKKSSKQAAEKRHKTSDPTPSLQPHAANIYHAHGSSDPTHDSNRDGRQRAPKQAGPDASSANAGIFLPAHAVRDQQPKASRSMALDLKSDVKKTVPAAGRSGMSLNDTEDLSPGWHAQSATKGGVSVAQVSPRDPLFQYSPADISGVPQHPSPRDLTFPPQPSPSLPSPSQPSPRDYHSPTVVSRESGIPSQQSPRDHSAPSQTWRVPGTGGRRLSEPPLPSPGGSIFSTTSSQNKGNRKKVSDGCDSYPVFFRNRYDVANIL